MVQITNNKNKLFFVFFLFFFYLFVFYSPVRPFNCCNEYKRLMRGWCWWLPTNSQSDSSFRKGNWKVLLLMLLLAVEHRRKTKEKKKKKKKGNSNLVQLPYGNGQGIRSITGGFLLPLLLLLLFGNKQQNIKNLNYVILYRQQQQQQLKQFEYFKRNCCRFNDNSNHS